MSNASTVRTSSITLHIRRALKIIHKTISFETVLQNFLYNMQHCFEKRDKTWSTGEGNGKPLQYCCLDNPMNNMTRQKDRTLKEELPGQQGPKMLLEEWRNDSKKNEEMEPKRK